MINLANISCYSCIIIISIVVLQYYYSCIIGPRIAIGVRRNLRIFLSSETFDIHSSPFSRSILSIGLYLNRNFVELLRNKESLLDSKNKIAQGRLVLNYTHLIGKHCLQSEIHLRNFPSSLFPFYWWEHFIGPTLSLHIIRSWSDCPSVSNFPLPYKLHSARCPAS